jgi:hypothetical protein
MTCSLVQFSKEPDVTQRGNVRQRWKFLDISQDGGGHPVFGDPAVTSSRPDWPDVVDIFTAGAFDRDVAGWPLVQFHKESSNHWAWFNISEDAAGRPLVFGNPAAMVTPGGVVDVFVRGEDNRPVVGKPLLHFHKEPNRDLSWEWTNVSRNAAEIIEARDFFLGGNPVVASSKPGAINVFITDDGGIGEGHVRPGRDLFSFSREPNSMQWQWFNISANAGGHRVFSDPAVNVNPDGTVDLYVVDGNEHLVQFHKEPNPKQWQWFDISKDAGHLAGGKPAIWLTNPANPDVVDIFARSGITGSHVVHFHKEPNPMHWTGVDISADSGHNVSGDLTVAATLPGVIDIFAQHETHLVQFHKELDGRHWEWTDITIDAGGNHELGWVGDFVWGMANGYPGVWVTDSWLVNIFAFGKCSI